MNTWYDEYLCEENIVKVGVQFITITRGADTISFKYNKCSLKDSKDIDIDIDVYLRDRGRNYRVNLFIGSEEQDHSIPAVCKGFEYNDEGYPVWYFTTHDGIEIAIESTSSNYDYLSPGAILYLEFKY